MKISNTMLMVDQRIQKPPNLKVFSSYDIFRKKMELCVLNTDVSVQAHSQELSGESSLKKVNEFLIAELKE